MGTLLSNKLQTVWTLPQIGECWQKLAQWLGLKEVISRDWVKRLPAVVAAGSLLAVFVSTAGIQPDGLMFVSTIALLGLAFTLMAGRSDQM